MTIFEYKGYEGSAEVDAESGFLVGKILFVNDLVTYEAKTVNGLRKAFTEAVDDYLKTCSELKREPQKPFNGIFNVRVSPLLHKAASTRAQRDGVKLNNVVVSALEQYLGLTTIKHAHKHDHTVHVNIVSLSPVQTLGSSSYGAEQHSFAEGGKHGAH